MPKSKDRKPADETEELRVSADSEDAAEGTGEGDDELAPQAPAPPAGGRHGALIAIVVVFIVIVLAALAYTAHAKKREAQARARDQARQVLGTQLTRVQDNLVMAQRNLEAETPDVEGAIDALNRVSEGIGGLAQQTLPTDPALANQLVDLQKQVREASSAIDGHSKQYLEAVQAAEKELKTSSLGELTPLSSKVGTLLTSTYGDTESPLRPPGAAGSAEEQTKEAGAPKAEQAPPGAAEQGQAGSKAEPSAP